jgi:hypothetical protein
MVRAWQAPLDYGLLDQGLLDWPAPSRPLLIAPARTRRLIAPARTRRLVARPVLPTEAVVNEILTVPPALDVATPETLPLAFDVSALLDGGDTVTSPAATLTDLMTGAVTTPAATASGTDVLVSVTGLASGHAYRLVATFTAATGKVLSTAVDLSCVF